jgi:tubulin monoglycylase TTLL3/8
MMHGAWCMVHAPCRYDFLIDDQLRVWLLEINSSPTMEASTPITTKLCAEVQEDILKVSIPQCVAKSVKV